MYDLRWARALASLHGGPMTRPDPDPATAKTLVEILRILAQLDEDEVRRVLNAIEAYYAPRQR
jgi:hypothetical protein